MDTYTPATNIGRMRDEIFYQRNRILNGLHVRQTHPTYGISKTEIKRDFAVLQGMVYAWVYVTGQWLHGASIMWNEDLNMIAMTELSVDLIALEAKVKAL